MPHNGYRAQVNLGYPAYWAKGFEFSNIVKLAGPWGNSGNPERLAPDLYNANGYPLSDAAGAGTFRQVWLPSQTLRPGNYKVRWEGRCSVSLGVSTTLVSGSLGLATDGEAIVTPTQADQGGYNYFNISFGDIDSGNPPTKLEIFHVDDEATLDAGNPFQSKFLERVSKFGFVRFLNPKLVNTDSGGGIVCKWAHEFPATAMSYGGYHCPAGDYKGETTNSGDDFSLSASGFTLDDKTVVLRWNTGYSVIEDVRLNVNSTGFYPVRSIGDPTILYSAQAPVAGGYAIVVFDPDLEVWVAQGQPGAAPGWPVSVCLDLCNRIGAHPWFQPYHLTLDPMTDYVGSMAAACKSFVEGTAPWMKPLFEPTNEDWNFAGAFGQTRWSWAKSYERWGGSTTDANNHYGRILSLMAGEIASVWPDASKYDIIAGVNEDGRTEASHDARLSGKHVSVDGGTPASNYVTRIAAAWYWLSGYTLQQELDAAIEYDGTASEDQQDYADDWMAECPNLDGTFFAESFEFWRDYADGKQKILTAYEGGPTFYKKTTDPTLLSSPHSGGNVRATITGISKASSAVITVASGSVFPAVGMDVSVASVTGMTEINGGPYEVLSVDRNARTITVDVDSTGFTTYSSGGSATLVGASDLIVALRNATKSSPAVETMVENVWDLFTLYGGRNPSHFNLTGNDEWSACQPTIYTALPAFDGSADWSTSGKVLRRRYRVQAP